MNIRWWGTVGRRTLSTRSTLSTLHEESAGGVNGRLAKLMHERAFEEVVRLYQKHMLAPSHDPVSREGDDTSKRVVARLKTPRVATRLKDKVITTPTSTPTPTPTSLSLAPETASAFNTITYNHLIEAHLLTGRHRDAFRIIFHMETHNIAPNRETFTALFRGLSEADGSGAIAHCIDELFELMVRRYRIVPDLEAWTWRIKAFLHRRFAHADRVVDDAGGVAAEDTILAPQLLYRQMRREMEESKRQRRSTSASASLNLRDSALTPVLVDLLATAVGRRLWPFAELMCEELRRLGNPPLGESFWFRITASRGLFSDATSLAVVRALQRRLLHEDALRLTTVSALHSSLLAYAWRQGRIAADVALAALRSLLRLAPERADWWTETAEACLQRHTPADHAFFVRHGIAGSMSGIVSPVSSRAMEYALTLGCSDEAVCELESFLRSRRLLVK